MRWTLTSSWENVSEGSGRRKLRQAQNVYSISWNLCSELCLLSPVTSLPPFLSCLAPSVIMHITPLDPNDTNPAMTNGTITRNTASSTPTFSPTTRLAEGPGASLAST